MGFRVFLFSFLIGVACAQGANPNEIVDYYIWSDIYSIHPTQTGYGPRTEKKKRRKFEALKESEQRVYMHDHPIDVILGPHNIKYPWDRHHHLRAAAKVGLRSAYLHVVRNWSLLGNAFYSRMESAGLLHLIDENGKHLTDPSHLPKTVWDMKEDPYFDLARAVRDEGAIEKHHSPFSETVIVEFLRLNIPPWDDFKDATEAALKLMATRKARDFCRMQLEAKAKIFNDFLAGRLE